MADISQTATSVIGYGEQLHGVLGGTVAAGMPVYKNTSNVWIASTNATLIGSQVDGIALSGGAIGQVFTYQKAGLINMGGTLPVGAIIVLSAAGAISAANDVVATDYITVLGVATTASLMKQAVIVSGVQAAGDVT